MKKIDSMVWTPKWVSHLGCMMGCLKHLKSDISDAWLYGGSGHAFILNIHDVICPSGPTAWRKERYHELIENVGIRSYHVVGHKSMSDFPEKQKQAHDLTVESIDDDRPVIAWELDIPEYHLINGYDEIGYYFTGAVSSKEKLVTPKPWQDVGKSEIGILEFEFPILVTPVDDEKIVHDALKFALDFSSTPAAMCFENYKAGVDGFDLWVKSIKEKTADDWGMAYNTAVWTECRTYAVEFLKETQTRLQGDVVPLLAEAEKHYNDVKIQLEELGKVFPFPPSDELKDESKVERGIELLHKARESEAKALKSVSKIVAMLSPDKTAESPECD